MEVKKQTKVEQKDFVVKDNWSENMQKSNVVKRIFEVVICMTLIMTLFAGVRINAFAQLTGTVTAGSANVRKEASTASEVLAGLKNGDVVSIAGEVTDADGTLWYEIHVDANTKGYVAASLITKDGDSAPVTNVTPTASETSTTTASTSGDFIDSEDLWKSATISSESVRVRKDASTSTDILATVTKGVVLTVTGSKTGTDNYKWYQVSFKVDGEDYLGFIREDLISFESVSTDGETTVIGTLDPNASEDETDAATEENEGAVEEPTENPEPEVVVTDKVTYTVIDTSKTIEVPSGYIEVPMQIEGGETKVWKNGDFYIVYATSSDGDEGWYRYDTVSGVYQRYVENESISSLDNEKTPANNLIIYILGGALAFMFIVCLFLLVRVSDMKTDLKYGDDEEDELEEDDLEDEEDADIFEEAYDVEKEKSDEIIKRIYNWRKI